ncbi:hypothetical protein CIB48_g3828 [Xylaria polymorpha]|nr:hypothetical protein CIB48_g3828 [Xylaria polymorpha]
MATPKGKTNFKTYEASTRLLAAVIATTGVKLDYAAIAVHIGSGVGENAINHRLRPIKQLARMQAACVARGEDPGELPTEKGAHFFPIFTTTTRRGSLSDECMEPTALASNLGGGATAVALQHRFRPVIQLAKMQLAYRKEGKDPGELPAEKAEIQKLFGESTPKGIEWQFRDIKSLGKAQQEAVKKGDNPAKVTVAGTPSANRSRGIAATPGSVRTPGTGTRGRKRKSPPGSVATTLPPVDSSDDNNNNNGAGDNDANDSDFGSIDTPSKRPSKRAATASARKASTTTTMTTPTPAPAPAKAKATAAPVSIFGGDARGPAAMVMQSTEVFNNGDNDDDDVQINGVRREAEYLSWAPRSVSKPRPIKLEMGVSANSFLTSVSRGSFDEGDYEDGEI